MNYLILSIIENIGPEAFWNILGRKSSQLFGRECAGSTIWMIFSLCLRSLITTLKLDQLLPNGIIFALPIFFQTLSTIFPFMKDNVPLLTVRLAESILGRLSPTQLLVVFPAHFIGCIMGAYFFYALCPPTYANLDPILYHETSVIAGTVFEIVLVALYTVLFIIIPELLHTNHLSMNWISPILFPCFFMTSISESSCFNPAALYGLWYLRSHIEVTNLSPIQVERIVGPILGAVLAGFFCLKLFPDDPSSWKRTLSF